MKKENRYIIRKFVLAQSAEDAIRKEKKTPVHDVWFDIEYEDNKELVGFKLPKDSR